MKPTAILFPGQGSQYPGMGIELYNACPTVPAIFECGSDILGIDLKKVLANSDAETLSQTEIAQPAIFVTSLAAYECAINAGIFHFAICGHSLGEYTALVASEVVSIETGFRLIKARAAAMSYYTKEQNGAMAAIIGLSAEEVAAECETVAGYVVPVNLNSPVQTVIAGEAEAVAQAMEQFKMRGKKAIKLAVSAAFHSALMKPAAEAFYSEIKNEKFSLPTANFYSNLTGRLLNDFYDMPTYLKNHMISPVRFVDQLLAMKAANITNFIECGPGKTLCGLIKKTLKDISIQNIEDERSLSCLSQK